MTDAARQRAIEHYATARPDLDRQLALFGKLWEAQEGYEVDAAEYTPAPADDMQRALRQHQTLFSLATPTIPLEPYRAAVRGIAALLTDDAGLAEEQTTALAETDLGAAVSEDALGRALSGFDFFVSAVADEAADTRISEPLLSFVLGEALTPFVRGAAKAAVAGVGKFDWLQWDSGLCPSCGTPASSGVVRDEGELQGGRRWMSCPLCRTQWEYARLRCIRCGIREHTQLEYLYDEEDPAHRIHTCAVCHGYSPVTFEKDLRLIASPEVEEVVMIRLETVAANRGFTPLGDDTGETPN